jgi:hypothetical protein
MTRRGAIGATFLLAPGIAAAAKAHVEIPLLRITDKHAHSAAGKRSEFLEGVWKQAEEVFASGGMKLRAIDRDGEVLQYPSGRPLLRCLDRSMINVVVTDRVPLDWDKGRSLAGVSSLYEGFCLCVISTEEAHGNQIPFLSVNTVVHELLHALLHDVFVDRTSVIHGQAAEARVDLYATRLWLFGDGAAVRESARQCLDRLSRMPHDTGRPASCQSS